MPRKGEGQEVKGVTQKGTVDKDIFNFNFMNITKFPYKSYSRFKRDRM
ncbi:MAG TPA: hypothetical protein VFU79_08195 [Nitrososphaeraceae archaeon]|nr:hypothetical protein [Nitrososphaeraceae archaeon]